MTFFGKPGMASTALQRAFRDEGYRHGPDAKSVRLAIDLRASSWKPGTLGRTLDAVKQGAMPVARRALEDVTVPELFEQCTTAHKWLLGRTSHKTSHSARSHILTPCCVKFVDEAVMSRIIVKAGVVQRVYLE